jgi:uncharacterized membrane protein
MTRAKLVLVTARFFSGPVMIALGLNHFVMTRAYESIVPDYLPAHRALVYASGVAEALGGLGTMFPSTRRPAGWFLIATLVAIFPANVYMAMNPELYPGVPGGETTLIARLPFQVLFVYFVWLAALDTSWEQPSA